MVKKLSRLQSSCFKRSKIMSGCNTMLQQKNSDQDCFSKQLSVKDFINKCFEYIGVKIDGA